MILNVLNVVKKKEVIMEKFCPDNCFYLEPKEKDQKLLKDSENMHVCNKYNQILKHEIYHPKIVKCKEFYWQEAKKEIID
jgi:hypothetical protein